MGGGGVGGCDTPTKVQLAGQELFLHGKMPANWLRCDEQKYETWFKKNIIKNFSQNL